MVEEKLTAFADAVFLEFVMSVKFVAKVVGCENANRGDAGQNSSESDL
jgi:hypothetical protein